MGTRAKVMLAAAVIVAAALRFPTLGDQSFWRDEASTALELNGSFGFAMRNLTDFEGMPPGYFALAWLWSQVFGLGEAGLRSLSALAGVATVPVAWALARALRPRAAPLAAGLVATSPLLVWYSQDARPYALLILLTALMTLFWVRDRRVAWGWAAAGALLTHYFAVFLIVPQAVLLVRRGARSRELAPLVVCGLSLAPLVAAQTDARVDWITDTSLGSRILDVGKHFATGAFGTPMDALGVLAGVALVAGAALARGQARVVLAVAAVAMALPVLLAVFGADYVLDRYLLASLVPLLAVVAVGLARAPGAAVALMVLFTVFTVTAATDRSLQREDWRALARDLPDRAFVLASRDALRPLLWYRRADVTRSTEPAVVDYAVLVDSHRTGRRRPATPPPPAGFVFERREDTPTTTAVFYVARPPLGVGPGGLVPLALDPRSEILRTR